MLFVVVWSKTSCDALLMMDSSGVCALEVAPCQRLMKTPAACCRRSVSAEIFIGIQSPSAYNFLHGYRHAPSSAALSAASHHGDAKRVRSERPLTLHSVLINNPASDRPGEMALPCPKNRSFTTCHTVNYCPFNSWPAFPANIATSNLLYLIELAATLCQVIMRF